MIRFVYLQVVLAALLLASFCARAEDATAAFENANKSYEEGKYAAAAAAYGKLIAAAGSVSEARLFQSRPTPCSKWGRLAGPRASYRQAEFHGSARS